VRDLEELARISVDCGFKIHSELGPGLLETAYESILSNALTRRGLSVERQKPIAIEYEGVTFAEGMKRIVNNHEDFASSRLRVNQVPNAQAVE
jgi:GxxExxY protein